jgi:hypothetical protein
MNNFYLASNGNILNTEMGCFQTVDGHYLRPVLHKELIYLTNLLVPVEFPEGLDNPDVFNLDEFALNKGEFESIFEWMNELSIYENLTDTDLVFKRSNHKDLKDFVRSSNSREFSISVVGSICINLKGLFFYVGNGNVYTLYDFNNILFVRPR